MSVQWKSKICQDLYLVMSRVEDLRRGDQRCRSVAARADFEVFVVWSCDVDDVDWCGDVRKTGCNRRCGSIK